MADTFDAVGGHAANMFYGSVTDDGKKTLQKATTAWEVIYYIPMTYGADVEVYVKGLSTISDAERKEALGFVKAVQGLKRFAPHFFSIRVPAAPWQPSTEQVKAALAPLGGAEKLRETWLESRNEALKALWAPLFVELFVGTLSITGFSEEFDQPHWGIGLVDETSNMKEAAAMDIKVGYFRHSPFTPDDKVERMNKKEGNSISRTAALRVCGLRRFRHDVTPHVKEAFGKEAGYAFNTVEELAAGVRAFFSTQGSLLKPASDAAGAALTIVDRQGMCDAVSVERQRATLKQIEEMIEFFEHSPDGTYLITHMAFVSASLLFMYDAVDEKGSAELRLIDFARSGHRHLNFDEEKIGFVQGLKNVKAYLSG